MQGHQVDSQDWNICPPENLKTYGCGYFKFVFMGCLSRIPSQTAAAQRLCLKFARAVTDRRQGKVLGLCRTLGNIRCKVCGHGVPNLEKEPKMNKVSWKYRAMIGPMPDYGTGITKLVLLRVVGRVVSGHFTHGM